MRSNGPACLANPLMAFMMAFGVVVSGVGIRSRSLIGSPISLRIRALIPDPPISTTRVRMGLEGAGAEGGGEVFLATVRTALLFIFAHTGTLPSSVRFQSGSNPSMQV